MHKGFLEVKEGFVKQGPVTGDYHWYRQDRDGRWSDKPGKEAVRKEPWPDPQQRIIRPGYKDCGFFCVPTGNARIE